VLYVICSPGAGVPSTVVFDSLTASLERGAHGRSSGSPSLRIRSTVSVASSTPIPASVSRATAPTMAIIGSDAASCNRRRTQSSRARRSASHGPARCHSRSEKMKVSPVEDCACRFDNPAMLQRRSLFCSGSRRAVAFKLSRWAAHRATARRPREGLGNGADLAVEAS
jgi:hypothetical protein